MLTGFELVDETEQVTFPKIDPKQAQAENSIIFDYIYPLVA
jgi:hypothetical protein